MTALNGKLDDTGATTGRESTHHEGAPLADKQGLGAAKYGPGVGPTGMCGTA